jgi:uncharacterized protein YggE
MRYPISAGSAYLLAGLALAPTLARAQEQSPPTIAVTGNAVLHVPADSATLTIAWVLGSAPGDAQQTEDAKIIAQLTALLKDAGAGNAPLRFSENQYWMTYGDDNENPERAQRQRKVDISITGRPVITEVLARLRNHPVLQVQGNEFSCTCHDEMERRAEALAFAQARKSAEALAAAAGGHVSGLVAVSNQPYGFSMAMPDFAASQAMSLNEASVKAPAPVDRASTTGDGLQAPLLEVRGMVFTMWRLGR